MYEIFAVFFTICNLIDIGSMVVYMFANETIMTNQKDPLS